MSYAYPPNSSRKEVWSYRVKKKRPAHRQRKEKERAP